MSKSASSRAAAPTPASKPGRGRRRFDIDRVIALRVAFAIVVVLFLYMILRVSMIAFGGSAQREAKRIERAIETSTVHVPAPVVGGTPKSGGTPSP